LTGTAAILSEANFPSDAAHTAPEEKTDLMTMTESTPQTAPSAPPAAPAPAELLVSMTDAAAAKVQELRSREGKTDAALRLFVKSGGCSGYSYGLAFDDKIADDDRVEDHAGVPVVIDASWAIEFISGSDAHAIDSGTFAARILAQNRRRPIRGGVVNYVALRTAPRRHGAHC